MKKTYVNLKPGKQYRFHWSLLNKPYYNPDMIYGGLIAAMFFSCIKTLGAGCKVCYFCHRFQYFSKLFFPKIVHNGFDFDFYQSSSLLSYFDFNYNFINVKKFCLILPQYFIRFYRILLVYYCHVYYLFIIIAFYLFVFLSKEKLSSNSASHIFNSTFNLYFEILIIICYTLWRSTPFKKLHPGLCRNSSRNMTENLDLYLCSKYMSSNKLIFCVPKRHKFTDNDGHNYLIVCLNIQKVLLLEVVNVVSRYQRDCRFQFVLSVS